MSWKKANSGKVNPNFKKDINYKKNCQSCVAVFEARLRGYNIEVLPFDMSNNKMYKLSENPTLAYIDKKTGKSPEFINIEVTNNKECEKWLKNNIKVGERYAFGYKPINSDSHHIIEVQKDRLGQLKFYDPQNGQSFDKSKLKEVSYDIKWFNIEIKQSPKVFRIDNAELNTEYLNNISKGID